ncbi:MAG: type IV pilin [Methanoregula sp.]|nr:type IV pilin [Methanoregula sp.]
MKNESGLTSVIGATLMILLVVMLVAIVAVLVSGFYHPIIKSAFIAPDINNQTISGKNIISVFNRGGDTAYLVSSGIALYSMSIFVDTSSGSYRAQPLPGIDAFGPGTTLYIYNSSAGYRITNQVSDIALPIAQSVPFSPIGIRLVDENAHILIAQWGDQTFSLPTQSTTITVPPTTSPTPTPVPTASGLTLTSISPSTAVTKGPDFTLDVYGTGFVSGSIVTWHNAPKTTTYISSTHLSAALRTADIAASQTRSVGVTNPGPVYSNTLPFVVT